MARRPRIPKTAPKEDGLNLAPIMNLVMILIPLLLLSVVFEQTGVINVSAPSMTLGTIPQEEITEPPLSLQIQVSTDGFTLNAEGNRLPPVEGCPTDSNTGATVCPQQSSDQIKRALQESLALRERYEATGDQALLEASYQKLASAREGLGYRKLYNLLVDLKRKHPEETKVIVSAEPNVPFELLIATMDTARFRLESPRDDGHFADERAFKSAAYQDDVTGVSRAILFSDVSLAVVQ